MKRLCLIFAKCEIWSSMLTWKICQQKLEIEWMTGHFSSERKFLVLDNAELCYIPLIKRVLGALIYLFFWTWTLSLLQIKCQNVIILSATNVSELKMQWDCLVELPSTPVTRMAPFVSKHLSTMLSDVFPCAFDLLLSPMCCSFSMCFSF